jgi:hypothetical protein
VSYLAEVAGLAVNAATYRLYRLGERELLAFEWFIEPGDASERGVRNEGALALGMWFVNVGPDPNVAWEDNRRFAYIGARGGSVYARRLFNMEDGDWFFAYRKASNGVRGYVGFGEVVGAPRLASTAVIDGRPFLSLPIDATAFLRDADNTDLAAHVIPVRWIKTVAEADARRFKGAFANQNVACRLTDAATLDFLRREFGS